MCCNGENVQLNEVSSPKDGNGISSSLNKREYDGTVTLYKHFLTCYRLHITFYSSPNNTSVWSQLQDTQNASKWNRMHVGSFCGKYEM